ncbi:hypothetical protein BDZ89DRAFT_1107671 [Hymenopellis radicata]|nr:hypothetical protein BDZ89DRAFT_1107671 [Hymenopellis radicata]
MCGPQSFYFLTRNNSVAHASRAFPRSIEREAFAWHDPSRRQDVQVGVDRVRKSGKSGQQICTLGEASVTPECAHSTERRRYRRFCGNEEALYMICQCFRERESVRPGVRLEDLQGTFGPNATLRHLVSIDRIESFYPNYRIIVRAPHVSMPFFIPRVMDVNPAAIAIVTQVARRHPQRPMQKLWEERPGSKWFQKSRSRPTTVNPDSEPVQIADNRARDNEESRRGFHDATWITEITRILVATKLEAWGAGTRQKGVKISLWWRHTLRKTSSGVSSRPLYRPINTPALEIPPFVHERDLRRSSSASSAFSYAPAKVTSPEWGSSLIVASNVGSTEYNAR